MVLMMMMVVVVARERSISNKGSSSRCEASDTPQRSLRAFCSSSKDDSSQTILHVLCTRRLLLNPIYSASTKHCAGWHCETHQVRPFSGCMMMRTVHPGASNTIGTFLVIAEEHLEYCKACTTLDRLLLFMTNPILVLELS